MLSQLKRKVVVVLENDTVVTEVPNKNHNSESGSNIKIFLILFFIIGLLVIILLFISRIRDLLRTKHYPQNYNLGHLEAAERRRRSSTATTTTSGRRTRERFLIRPDAEEIRRRRSSRLARLNSFIRFWRQQSGNNATEAGSGQLSSSTTTADGFGRRHTIAMTDSSVEPSNTVGELTNEQYLQLFNQILRSELTTTAASGGGVNPMLRHLLGNYSPQYQQTVENELWQLVANQPPPSYSEVMINKDQFREPKILVDETNSSTILSHNEETERQSPSLATRSIETYNENSLVEPPPPSYSQLSKIV